MSIAPQLIRGPIFVALSASLVGLYCVLMSGKLEPLKHEPTRFVTLPLMVITAVIAALLFPLLFRQRQRLVRSLTLYCGFVLISAVYGIYLWILFPDGSPWAVLLTIVGGHLYGWPVFIAVLVMQIVGARLFFPHPNRDSRRSDS